MRTLTALTLMLVPAVAFAGAGGDTAKHGPAKTEKIAGSELSTVTLTAKAAERTGIETVVVREDTVTRTWSVGGVISSPAAIMVAARSDGARANRLALSEVRGAVGSAMPRAGLAGGLLVSVAVSPSELSSVAVDRPARIMALTRGANKTWLTAMPIGKLPIGVNGSAHRSRVMLHYAVAGTGHGLVAGQRVSVELARVGAGMPQKIVPYSSVLYDTRGNTWVYISPAPLVFVRHAIAVDFIDGDIAVLTSGPAVGARVVSVGVPELYGAETGIGK